MVSIKDVAKQAGVAISTVSKVLNGYGGVSEETKEKVNQAIRELNYIPNSIAAALSSKKAGRIALLVHMSTQTKAIDEIAMQYISGGIHKAQEQKLDLSVVFFSMMENKTLQEMVQYFQVQNIEGIIIYGMTRDDKKIRQLAEEGPFKIVLVDAPAAGQQMSSVGIEQKQAQMDVAWKTIQENHCRKILYIAGKKNSYTALERLEGMETLAAEKDLDLLIRYGEFSEKKAREITFRYAEKRDAVICGSDLMAIGAMRALIEMDIFRPVCGFDGLIIMGYAGKQMNTLQQDFAEISARAVEEMQYLLEGGAGRRVITQHAVKRIRYLDMIGMTDNQSRIETGKKKAFSQRRKKNVTVKCTAGSVKKHNGGAADQTGTGKA